ncbi:MAG TPA: alpha/beta fold hydrolase [Trebonia sp.]|nr:alpha/beta fold hydrolase [Trebonia sp.]
MVIEPSFGGAAEDWVKIAHQLSEEMTVVTYDRAPYGASSAARDARTPQEIAADLGCLLTELGVAGPLVLVGHSAGGVYVRAYAAEHLDRVVGMVLVESSHENQRKMLDPLRSRKARLQMAFMVWSIMREPVEKRRGADPRSVIREWRAFRRATAQASFLAAGALGDRPLAVLTCAPGDPAVPDRVYQGWRDLHRDLAQLSANSRHEVSLSPSHYLMAGDPELVTTAIRDVVRCARSGEKLFEVAAARAEEN